MYVLCKVASHAADEGKDDCAFFSPLATTALAPSNVALTDFTDDVYTRAFLGRE